MPGNLSCFCQFVSMGRTIGAFIVKMSRADFPAFIYVLFYHMVRTIELWHVSCFIRATEHGKGMVMEKYRIPRKTLARITRISAYSFVLVVMTFLGLYGGIYLDRATNMAPNFTFLGLIVGIVLGFKGFIQEAIIERRKGS